MGNPFGGVDTSRPMITGAFFSLNDVGRTHPLNWDFGKQMLQEAMTQPADYNDLIISIGHAIKDSWVRNLSMGAHHGPPELSPWTLAKKDSSNGGFLFDTGKLVGSFEVVLEKHSAGRSGAAGVAIKPDPTAQTSHTTSGGVMNNLELINMLCQTGIVKYADEMDPEALQRLMAWRRFNFQPFDVGEEVYETTTDTYEIVAERKTSKADRRSHTEMRTEMVGRRRPVIFIPPRPLLTPEMEADAEKAGMMIAQEYFHESVQIASHILGMEPWDPNMRTRYRARLKLIDPIKRLAPFINVKD